MKQFIGISGYNGEICSEDRETTPWEVPINIVDPVETTRQLPLNGMKT
jgi:hypothetical protein